MTEKINSGGCIWCAQCGQAVVCEICKKCVPCEAHDYDIHEAFKK